MSEAEFDRHAGRYEASLDQALSVTGEHMAYYAQGRIAWLCRCLTRIGHRPTSVLDFGCGTGSATPYLLDVLKVSTVTGVDISPKSIAVASRQWSSDKVSFFLLGDAPRRSYDVAFCNGVFHHIAISEQGDAARYVYRALAPGGIFAFWENSPWNPGTRYVMSRCSFDQNAMCLSPPKSRRLLKAQGFEILRTDFLFIFPSALGWLRPLEPVMASLPFGGQYQILCRKP